MASFDAQTIRDWCRLLFVPGDVFHVRASASGQSLTGAFHYNDLDQLVERLEELGRVHTDLAVRVAVNPVRAELLTQGAFGANGPSVRTADIREWRWLAVVMRGDAASALDLCQRMASTLGAEGWASPVIARAPDGAALLYRVRLRNDADDAELVRRCQQTLQERFLTQGAQVTLDGCQPDVAIGLPGVGSRDTRWRVERAPARLELVARDQLIAGRAPEVQASSDWIDDAFESGLEQLERQFAEVPLRGATQDYRDFVAAPTPTESLRIDPDHVPGAPAPFEPPPAARVEPPPVPSLAPLPTSDSAPPAAPSTALLPVRTAVTAIAVRLPMTSFEAAFERYRDQHRDPGGRIGTSFPEIDKMSGGLRGLVLLDGGAGEGRSTLGHQILTHALLSDTVGSLAGVVISTGLREQDVIDRLMSHVSRLSLDVLLHGNTKQRVNEQDGLRLDARSRKQLKDAIARLSHVQSRLFVVDAEMLAQLATRGRVRDAVAAVVSDARRTTGARRCVCLFDDVSGGQELLPGVDMSAELQAASRACPDDPLLAVTTNGGPEPLRLAASLRVMLSRGAGEPRIGMEPMRLAVATRRGGAADGYVALRFYYREHRFDLDS